MPAGVRVLEASLLRHYPADDIACCYPADLDKFIGPDTRVVAVSTHNPLGVTFAAGVYTSIFGSSQAADQLALLEGAVRRDQGERPSFGLQGDRRRVGRLADHPDQFLGTT